MTAEEIAYFYDQNPNLTLAELSHMTGEPVSNLKKILMGNS